MSEGTSTKRAGAVPSARAAVWLVTKRETAARVANRAYVIGTLVNVGVILGLLYFLAPSTPDDHGTTGTATVAVTGVPVGAVARGPAGKDATRWRPAADENAARRQVTGKKADAALVVDGSRVRMLVRTDTPGQVRATVVASVRQWATTRALHAQHVDTDRLTHEVTAALPRTETVDRTGHTPPDTHGGAELGAAIGIVTILFFQLFGYWMMVAQGVVEEKSTRVVEVLLATLTPLRLMVGKVAGIGAAAVLQTAVFGVTAVLAVRFGHALPARFPATPATLAALGWFVLGFAFFAFLFAAAGSLVSRAEDVSSAVMPVLMATLVPFGVAIAAAQDLNAGWVQVVRYIPPFSMLIMPLQVSVHEAGWLPNLLAALLMLTAATALATLSARVYRRSILRMGATVRWREALTPTG
ncbi:ABC transporter permease [Streptomyces guryensis]|uniref:ABC transporter permease n=1 Tax=Streptomyces guryensis TaxID=2886947 RepID=A0A9Q3VUK8_9ACTN|nr:ABC transporter permease [Streptomyces guryensis]MCD9878889.1 ABC transporter permease [Streptomyces guryensis]